MDDTWDALAREPDGHVVKLLIQRRRIPAAMAGEAVPATPAGVDGEARCAVGMERTARPVLPAARVQLKPGRTGNVKRVKHRRAPPEMP